MNPITRHLLASGAAIVLTASLVGCSKAPAPTASTPPAVAAEVTDTDVTNHVTTALLADPLLQGAAITVITSKGDVRLTGTLASQAQIDQALKVARAAEGSHTIHDELVLKP